MSIMKLLEWAVSTKDKIDELQETYKTYYTKYDNENKTITNPSESLSQLDIVGKAFSSTLAKEAIVRRVGFSPQIITIK